MPTLRTYMIAGLGLGVVGVLSSATNVGPAFAQGVLRPVEALIVNTSAAPVPVAGQVSVSNAPGLQPYSCTVQISVNALGVEAACPEVVPAGKRLVVEHLSASVAAEAGNRSAVGMRFLPLEVGAVPVVRVPLFFQYTDIRDVYVGSAAVRYYVEAGKAPSIVVGSNDDDGIFVTGTVIGYLIDLPAE